MTTSRSLLVTDLDNTLWDWFAAWHASFSALLGALEGLSGIDSATLEPEIRKVHQLRGTTEYSHLLNEVPALIDAAKGRPPMEAFDEAVHRMNSERRKHTALYPGVLDTLTKLKSQGVRIVAYTESVAYWTEWRIKHTGLDGIIDVLYSAPDHDLPTGVEFRDIRRRSDGEFGLKKTSHQHVPRGVTKPSPEILKAILDDSDKTCVEAVYVGDSLMKDIVMAQAVGVLDVHAKYGEPQGLEQYGLLQKVSHWPDRDVEREQEILDKRDIYASRVLESGFAGVADLFVG
ncbi:haloacid dehalogenase [Nocardioides sp. Soil797]|nr:haloacid dehalogenase [Nocardioides sp. Soil797]